MTQAFSFQTKSALENMNFREIEKRIVECPSLIVPLGSIEPFGPSAPSGVAGYCCRALAYAFAERSGACVGPLVPFSCAVPFMSFGGSAVVKPRTFTNLIIDLFHGWIYQGFKNIIMIDTSGDNVSPMELAQKRLSAKYAKCQFIYLNIHTDNQVRAFISKHVKATEYGRTEFGILSLAAYIDEINFSNFGMSQERKLPEQEKYRRWCKTGMDPDKFRKLFPEGSCSSYGVKPDALFGKELFGYILTLLDAAMQKTTGYTVKGNKDNVA